MGYFAESGFKIELVDLTSTGTIAPAGTDAITLQPPEGYAYQILDMNLRASLPAGGSSGTHEFKGRITGNYHDEFWVIAAFNSVVYIAPYDFNGPDTERPTAIGQQFPTIHETMYCTNDNPLVITYTNDTDVDQTGSRTVIVIVKKTRQV